MELKNKVVLITGASSGIGKELYDTLKSYGAKVFGTSRKKDNELLYLDLTQHESINKCIDDVITKAGKIDILINNAGYGIAGAIEDTPMEDIKRQIDVNLFGTIQVIKKTLEYMRMSKDGKILVVSSVAGFLSIPYQSIYSASKFALEAIVDGLYNETKDFGIEYMIINPGDTKTSFKENRVFFTKKNSVYYKKFKKSISKMEKAEENGMKPSIIAHGIIKRLKRKNMAYRYVPKQYYLVYLLVRIIPKKLVFKLLELIYL